jgi:hypothetical protein
LRDLGTALAQAQLWEQASQVWAEAERVIGLISDSHEQIRALSALGTALAQAQQWERAARVCAEAEQAIGTLRYSNQQVRALSAQVVALAQAQQWAEAERIVASIPDRSEQVRALKKLSAAMAGADGFKRLLHMTQHAWRQVETRAEALTLFSIASPFICHKPEVGIAFIAAFNWVDTFLGGRE